MGQEPAVHHVLEDDEAAQDVVLVVPGSALRKLVEGPRRVWGRRAVHADRVVEDVGCHVQRVHDDEGPELIRPGPDGVGHGLLLASDTRKK